MNARLQAIEEDLGLEDRHWLTVGQVCELYKAYFGISRATFYRRFRHKLHFGEVGRLPKAVVIETLVQIQARASKG